LIDGEQLNRKPSGIKADSKQVGQWGLETGSTKDMKMTMFMIAAMAVVVALGAADAIN
jgi:hypothetical protein